MKKRLLSILLCLCMVVTLLPAAALAVDEPVQSVTCGDLVLSTENAKGLIDGTDYTYASNVLTIKSAKAVTIGMADGVDQTRTDSITVPAGIEVHITLADVDIYGVAAPFHVYSNNDTPTVVNLTLTGENSFVGYSAGLQNSMNSTLTIDGDGSLYAECIGGNGNGAGIGGTYYYSTNYQNKAENTAHGGTIIINGGTITAKGGNNAAGIGDGNYRGSPAYSVSASVTINGGIVTAIGGADDIGKGQDPTTGQSFSTGTDGNAVIYADKITDKKDTSDWDCILLGRTEPTGVVYGDVLLADDLTIPEGTTLTIPEGAALTIGEGVSFTNHGTLIIAGTLNGAVENDGVVYLVRGGNIDDADISGNTEIIYADALAGALLLIGDDLEEDTDYSFANHTLMILSDKPVTITGRSTHDKIEIAADTDANLTLDNLSIDVSGTANAGALYVNNDAVLKLTLNETNTLKSGSGCAGIGVPSNAELTIAQDSTGSLIVAGGTNSAGIGGDNRETGAKASNDAGTITIGGGTITAAGGIYGAGIGSGNANSHAADHAAKIIITGGNITATGGKDAKYGGAGIGTGSGGGGFTIAISGGIINAAGSANAADIGGGYFDTRKQGSFIEISGGTITTTGDNIGIGSGTNPMNTIDRTITLAITGGSMNATTNLTAKNSTVEGEEVSLTTVTLDGAGAFAKVSATSLGSSYGVTDVQTDKDSKLYFWLPSDASISSVTAENVVYGSTEPIMVGNSGTLSSYIITLNANGGTVTPGSLRTEADMTLATLPKPSRPGHFLFGGWYLSDDTRVTTETVFTDDTTITAKWIRTVSASGTAYTLTFETNGGSKISPVSAAKGTTIRLSDYEPAMDGYTFAGWYADSKLTDKVTSVTLDQSMTVYAKWAEASALPFADVAVSDWAYDSIVYAYKNGLFNGVSTTEFGPEQNMTREQMWMVLARMADKKPASMSDARAWAMENGISDGTNAKIAVTREQFVTLLWRAAGSPKATKELSGYNDIDTVSSFAKDAMAWAVEAGILSGTNGSLNPTGAASRAEIAAILHRYCANQ